MPGTPGKTPSSPPPETPLAEDDAIYLRDAIALSFKARAGGNRPFGAVIVSADGHVLARAWNRISETGDCTAHAETSAVREVSGKVDRKTLETATLYASGEPCVMCAGSIYLSGIRRLVYGVDAQRLRRFRTRPVHQDIALSVRQVFSASPATIDCVGPALIDEATKAHEGAWEA